MGSTAIRRVTTPAGDPAWLVTGYDDIKALLSDPRLGRSHAEPERAARVTQSAIFGGPISHPAIEAAGHARFRRLVAPAFSARRMASLRHRIADIIADLLEAMAHHAQPVDLHEALSFPLPALVICELLGVPYADREDFRRWSDPNPRVVARHGLQMMIGALLTWDDGGYHATIIRVERTPIGWTGYAVCAGYGGWWVSARRTGR